MCFTATMTTAILRTSLTSNTVPAFGVTPKEALHEVLKAKQVWLEAARASSKPIPAPRYRPAIYQARGGQVRGHEG